MNLSGWIDKAVSAPFPSWGARRALARLKAEAARQNIAALSTFSAARKDRTLADWNPKIQSADGAMLPEIDTINGRARLAFYNDATGRSTIRSHRRHIIGKGISIRANARDLKTDKELAEINAWQNWFFSRWARHPRFCDIERRKTFLGFQRLLVQEWKTVGQAFVILNYIPRPETVGLLLQACEKEQLDTARIRNEQNKNEIRRGIEIDEYGAPVAYWFYTKRHPLDYTLRASTSESVRVPAERVIDLMEQDRVRQTEGMTPLSASLNAMWLKQMGTEYMLHRWRMEACMGLGLTVAPEADVSQLGGFMNAANSQTDENGNLKYELGPGMIWPFPAGIQADIKAIQAPGGQYVPFNQQQTREIAAGADSDYPTVARDFTQGSYSSQLQGLNETYMEVTPDQQLVIDLFCRPVWEAFQTFAILEGRYAAPQFFMSPDSRASILEAEFCPQPKPDINPTDTAASRKMKLDSRIATRKMICAEDGNDEREIMRGTSEEKKFADSLDPPVPLPDWQEGGPNVSPHESRPGAQQDRAVNSTTGGAKNEA